MLFEQAVQNEELRKKVEREISEKGQSEAEMQNRDRSNQEIGAEEAKRHFRGTLEWMVEQKHDQINELALIFLNSNSPKIKNININ